MNDCLFVLSSSDLIRFVQFTVGTSQATTISVPNCRRQTQPVQLAIGGSDSEEGSRNEHPSLCETASYCGSGTRNLTFVREGAWRRANTGG